MPWQVLQELDSIKDRCTRNRSLKQRVTTAIRFIGASLKVKHKRVIFQDQDTMEQSRQVLGHQSPDDRILAAGLQLIATLNKVRRSLVVRIISSTLHSQLYFLFILKSTNQKYLVVALYSPPVHSVNNIKA